MLSFTLVVCAGALFASAAQLRGSKPHYDLEDAEKHFAEFVRDYDRHYANEHERQKRFEIFKGTLIEINKRNEKEEHAEFGITSFADMTREEFLKRHTGYVENGDLKLSNCTRKTGADVPMHATPDAFDWRDHNAVTDVKNQGFCGSCWAFSIIGNLEGQYSIKNKKLIDLSTQQLLDCDDNDHACNGGFSARAALVLKKMGGVMSDEDYPYVEIKQLDCHFDIKKSKAKVVDVYQYDLNNDEEKLKSLLHSQGPLSIALNGESLLTYKKGIMEVCAGQYINHAVVLVGYGEEKGIPYWIIKNSWGMKFGEQGYFRVKRGINACGLMNAVQVTVIL